IVGFEFSQRGCIRLRQIRNPDSNSVNSRTIMPTIHANTILLPLFICLIKLGTNRSQHGHKSGFFQVTTIKEPHHSSGESRQSQPAPGVPQLPRAFLTRARYTEVRTESWFFIIVGVSYICDRIP